VDCLAACPELRVVGAVLVFSSSQVKQGPIPEVIYQALLTSNGKTSLVQYRTLSFFAFRFKKKRKFAFFSWF
jgi:hypothetical protein